MPHVLPQVAAQRVIAEGVQILKQNIDVLNDIFIYYTSPEMNADYGQTYIDKIKTWFKNTKIPVVQAWSMSMAQVPQVSIQLAQEQEAENLAAIGDHWGTDDVGNIGVGVFNVTLDIMLFGTKNSDEILWLYYIVSYILFKRKRQAEALGLQQHTFSATDYARDMPKLPENVWVRTIKFKALAENFWSAEPYLDIGEIDIELTIENPENDDSVSESFVIDLDDN